MSVRTIVWLSTVGVCFAFLTGCASQTTEMAMKFTAGDTTTYQVATITAKSYKFEQPSLNKSVAEMSNSKVKIIFDQEIESVSNTGATANITIKSLKYIKRQNDGTGFEFDSEREQNKAAPLSGLIGQSYKISISGNGKVQVLDANDIRGAVKGGFFGTIADSLLSNTGIRKRHEVLALPDPAGGPLKEGDSWSKVTGTPEGMLIPKSFEKTYTLERIENRQGHKIAIVKMNAAESAEMSEGLPKGAVGMGAFANIFDAEETYTGRMVFDLANAEVKEYSEQLDATYTAIEESQQQQADKGPDTLIMGYVYGIGVKKID